MPKTYYKVNFNNPKVQRVCAVMAIGENRITRQELVNICGTTLLYQLKNAGLIKSVSKNKFSATQKLHKAYYKNTGKHFSSSCSEEHAAAVRRTLELLPSSVLERRSFATGYDIDNNFERFKRTCTQFKDRFFSLKREYEMKRERLVSCHRKNLKILPKDGIDRYIENLSYLKEKEFLDSICVDFALGHPYLTPDYQVTLDRTELEEFIFNLSQEKDRYPECSNEGIYITQAINQLMYLQDVSEGPVTVNIEVVTDSYGNREIERHKIFEKLSDTPQILLWQRR